MEPILIDTKIFDDVSLADICRVVYLNSNYKKNKIDNIIEKVKPLLQNVADVSIVLPILKEVLDICVKNEEKMVKLAAIVSRLLDKNDGGKDNNPFDILPLEERKRLLDNNKQITDNEETDKKIEKLEVQMKEAKKFIKENKKQINVNT